MKARHKVWVLEDDPMIADVVRDILEAMGIECIHFLTVEDLLAGLAKCDDACMAIVDVQAKANERSLVPRLEAGMTAMRELRFTFPGRNAITDRHIFQILAMSGQHKRVHEVTEARMFADNFIEKPFSESPMSLAEHVNLCLRHGGRTNHDDCGRLNAMARPRVEEMVPAVEGGSPDRVIEVLGPLPGKRQSVLVADTLRSVRAAPMKILRALIKGREATAEGWIDKETLGQAQPGANGISRLRDDLGDPTTVESDGDGHYRLALHWTVRRSPGIAATVAGRATRKARAAPPSDTAINARVRSAS